MKAKDLRKGNCVNKDGVMVIADTLLIHQYNSLLMLLEPIPLTEEWLLKFGFEEPEFTHGLYVKGCLNIVIGTNNIWRDTFIKVNDNIVTIHQEESTSEGSRFVHQLQNLYFEITGEELKLEG